MTTQVNDDIGRRILVIGSTDWTSRRLVIDALERVMRVFRGPYTLVCDMTDGASRYAAAAARDLGWKVESHEYDPTKCDASCPTENHRRAGGPGGDWCPTAKVRNLNKMLELGVDQALVLYYGQPAVIRRDGTKEIKENGIGVWSYIQKPQKPNRTRKEINGHGR